MVITRPGLLLRTMSRFMILLYLRSVLKSMARLAVKSHMDPWVWSTTYSLDGVQGPCCGQSHPEMGGRGIHLEPVFIVLLQPGSALSRVLYCHQRSHRSSGLGPQREASIVSRDQVTIKIISTRVRMVCLCFHPKSGCCLGPRCCQGPYLGPWSSCS